MAVKRWRIRGHPLNCSKWIESEDEAQAVIEHQKSVIEDNWDSVCNEAQLSEVDRALFWHRQFLNPYAFEGAYSGAR